MVGARVRHDQEAGLPEGRLDLIGERAGSEASVEGGGSGGRGKLQHGPLHRKRNNASGNTTSALAWQRSQTAG